MTPTSSTAFASADAVCRWRCDCGLVRGAVDTSAPHRSLRVICHCRTCRAFAEALGRETDRLDEHGGTDVVAVSPAAFSVDAGMDRLASLSFSHRVLRWYAACCRTPLLNSGPGPWLPYLSIPVASFDAYRLAQSPGIDAAFGRPLASIQATTCSGGGPPGAHRRVPLALLGRALMLLAGRWRRSEHRCSVLFGPDGRPIAPPMRLAPGQRLPERLVDAG